jgi:hypothetical protein
MPDRTNDTPLPTPEQLSAAATSGPQPSAPQSPPTPTPAPGAQSPQPATRPTPPPTPAQQIDAHHNMLGRVASALLGKQIDYRVNPSTGLQEAYEVPQKPGDMFRHILAGALIGGAAAKGTNSILAGATSGGTAVMQANQAQARQRQAQAQQNFANQQGLDRAAQEKIQAAAQAEHWNKEQLLHERDANLRDAEFIDRQNENSNQMEKWAQEAGAIPAPIEGNGELKNGRAMMEKFTRDPAKFRPPEGYTRIITHDIDTSGLTHDHTGGWTDHEGNPVSLEDRTTWRVSFIPQKPKPIEADGARLNKLFPKTIGGVADPNQTYNLPWNTVVALGHNEHQSMRQDDDEDRKNDREDRLKKTAAREQNRKDVDQTRKNKLADQKLNQKKPVAIGSIGIVNGQRVMVTKVDENGVPTAGVPAP